jgi:type I restriction enzyme S subunit
MFLLYFMLGDEIQGRLLGRSTGATVRHLNMKDIRNLELPRLPTLPTQRKIAAVLSAYDDLIENNTRRIKILEDMAQSIYREWFVNFRFPGHKQVKMVASELGLIPEGWELVKIEQIVKRVPSGKKYSQKTVEQAGSVPVLDQGKSGIIGYHNDAPGVIASEDEPIIVFANHTCYQRMIQFPFSAIQNVLPFLPHSEKHRNIYWLHWATKDLVDFNDYKGHWPEFMSKELSLPPVAICKQFGELIKPMVHLTHSFDRRNQNLRQTRDLLLPKLISGEIDVSDLDIATD